MGPRRYVCQVMNELRKKVHCMGFLAVPISRWHQKRFSTWVEGFNQKAKYFEGLARLAQRRRDELRGEITQMEAALVNMKAEIRAYREEMRVAECDKCDGQGCNFCKYGFDGFGDLF